MKNITVFTLLSCFLLVSGCAGTAVPRIPAQHYPQCVQPLVHMQNSDTTVARQTAGSVLLGALGGAVIGFITTGDVGGAAVGGLLGAAAGGIVGYSFAKLDQISDENTRFASIRITANQDLSHANRLQLYAYQAMQCYILEFEKLHAAYLDGKVLLPDYTERFLEIRTAMQELGGLIGNMEQQISRTEKEFTASLSKVQAAPEIKTTTPPPRRRPRSTLRTASAALTVQNAEVEKAQEIQDEDLTAILNDFAGKVTPPQQDIQTIGRTYGKDYADTRTRIQDLRAAHREVMDIMDQAALEAGIDMV